MAMGSVPSLWISCCASSRLVWWICSSDRAPRVCTPEIVSPRRPASESRLIGSPTLSFQAHPLCAISLARARLRSAADATSRQQEVYCQFPASVTAGYVPAADTRIAHTWRSFVRKIYRLIFHLHAISRCKVGCERYGQSPALRMLALAQAHAPPAGHRSDLDGRRVAPLAGARADSRDRACRGARGAADRRAATRAGRDAQRMAGAEDSALAELIPEPHSQSRTHRGSGRAPSARLPNPLRRAGLGRERRRQRAAGGSRRRRPGGRWPPPGGWHTRRAPGTPPLWRPGPARHHPTARPIYQVPRSPSFAMTSLNRSAALRQFPCTARSVASGSPCRIASTIASCSTVDSSMRSASALMYSQQ